MIIFSSILVMISFQNCGPSMQVNDSEFVTEQINASLKPETQWTFVSATNSGEAIVLPNSFKAGLDFIERPGNPDLLCAGDCGIQYDLTVRANCSSAQGDYSRRFNELFGEYVNLVQLEQNARLAAQDCDLESWDEWLYQAITQDPEILVRYSDLKEQLVIKSGQIELLFTKQ